MSEPFVFDPWHFLCKEPFGAVACGQSVRFSCRPLSREGFTHCALVLCQEFSNVTREVELPFFQEEGDRICFTAEVSVPESPELIWYHFRFWRDDGGGCRLDKTGYRSDAPTEPWQLTVYEESFTPEWFGSGVTYQVFPDRFCRLSLPDPEGMVGNRWVHENWQDPPVWRPDPDGEVRNRDFFGGSLAGITAKLEELAAWGVSSLYLCPIFESASNHRYNTANYSKIDPMLGTEEDFKILCARARDLGIRVILDGVFNHTGSQSIYFNADGFYSSPGAAQAQDSPYSDWFSFRSWPETYDAWWGIRTLPAVQEDAPSYVNYIIEGEDSILRHWLRCGASGWRLDVADELPDWFIEKIRTVAAEEKPDAVVVGEVWEDASHKIAYSQRRKYLLGKELHGVMNYPFRNALLAYLRGGSAGDFRVSMETLRENYPPAAYHSAMNFLGTHDTARILTVLGADHTPQSKEERATHCLSPTERERGIALVKLAALVLFTFPGSPTVYYGDEAGMEGWEDPFNRGTYPWGRENLHLKAWFALLGNQRRLRPSLQQGSIRYLAAHGPLLVFAREFEGERTVTVVNPSNESLHFSHPDFHAEVQDLLSGVCYPAENGQLTLTIPPRSGLLLV